MKAFGRALILLAAACGFFVALSLSARADVVEPKSAYQPASTSLLSDEAAAELPKATDAAAAPAQEPEVAIERPVVAATPAPEHQVTRQVPTAIVPETSSSHGRALSDHIVHPLRIGLEHLKTSLGRVVSACEVGFGTGAGGPVLVLAVLGLAAPFIRRGIFAIPWATDEDVPEFRYVRELTPPG